MPRFWSPRAATPAAIAGRMSTGDNETLRILRGFDPPFAAMLVPMLATGERYFPLPGALIQSLSASAGDGSARNVAAPPTDGLFDLPPLPWPGNAERALVMVFYYGSRDTGGLIRGGGLDKHMDRDLTGPFAEAAARARASAAATTTVEFRRVEMLFPDDLFSAPIRTLRESESATRQDLLDAVTAYFRAQLDGIAGDHVALLHRASVSAQTPAQPPATPAPRNPGEPARTPGSSRSTAPPPPAPGAAEPFLFALASCQYPGGLIDRSLGVDVPGPYSVGVSDRSWFRLSQLPANEAPTLLVMAGDQVYVDATAGMFDPKTLDDGVRGAYRSLHGNRGYTTMFNRPITRVAMIDDHEIEDDWEPLPGMRAGLRTVPTSTLVAGACKYIDEARAGDSPGHLDGSYKLGPPRTSLAFEFAQRDHRFFMGDTRTEREGRNAANLLTARIMSDDQLARLKAFIDQEDDAPAFIVTPSMLLPRQLIVARQAMAGLHSDAWDGYPASLHALLAHIYARGRGNLVFLSGDAHLSCAARVGLYGARGPKPVVLHSVHSSALYAPFPFANAEEADFARTEAFTFPSGNEAEAARDLRCVVETYFPRAQGRAVGDGFALLSPVRAEEGWQVSVTFDGEHGRDRCFLRL